jgi:hypothetical protein
VRLHTILFHIRRAGARCAGVPCDADQKHQWRISGSVRSPGELFVQTYLRPDLKTGKIPAELLRWRMARHEMYIGTDSEIILKLSRAN